jgi:hypothetical protein
LKKGESSPGPNESRETLQREDNDASAPLICAGNDETNCAFTRAARTQTHQLPDTGEPEVFGGECDVKTAAVERIGRREGVKRFDDGKRTAALLLQTFELHPSHKAAHSPLHHGSLPQNNACQKFFAFRWGQRTKPTGCSSS